MTLNYISPLQVPKFDGRRAIGQMVHREMFVFIEVGVWAPHAEGTAGPPCIG